jgi:beta-glucosidase
VLKSGKDSVKKNGTHVDISIIFHISYFMKRIEFIKTAAAAGLSTFILPDLLRAQPEKEANLQQKNLIKTDFGADFKWGVATAAYQIEGAYKEDGKSLSIWDTFTHKKKHKIKNRENGDTACDFYHRYDSDIALVKAMNMDVFRFSLAWSRIMPDGVGKVNEKGVDFYRRVIDSCLQKGVEPWVTMYHWDIPQVLQDKGGWANRDVLKWFEEYALKITELYGKEVKNWMILNEPAAYTTLGYLAGIHAPGKIAPKKFLAAAHHAVLAMGIGGRAVRQNVENSYVGTTFSCSQVQPKNPRHQAAADRLNVMLNRLFVEPVLGQPYPTENFKFIKKIEKYVQEGDMERAKFDFDFIGLQNYTRVVGKRSLVPFLRANQVKPARRKIPYEFITEMNWEVYPDGMYNIIKQFAAYPNCPPIIITENGAAFRDNVANDSVHDTQRTQFYQNYLQSVLRAKQEGVDIRGYFCWTLMDNFEWAEGYHPRFGLVHVDFESQKRIIKDSGLWFKAFLSE